MVGRGNAFFKELVEKLSSKQFALQTINLSGNSINDEQIELFFSSLAKATLKPLVKLYLSKNLISCRGAKAIKQAFMETPNNIAELYLSWNKIYASGGKAIAKMLASNNSIKVLDLSWNVIGQQKVNAMNSKPGNIGPKWGSAFYENNTLLHLDLSFNKIAVDDCRIMGEKLRSNHTLYGIHFQGNAGKIDSLGFLEVSEQKALNLRV